MKLFTLIGANCILASACATEPAVGVDGIQANAIGQESADCKVAEHDCDAECTNKEHAKVPAADGTTRVASIALEDSPRKGATDPAVTIVLSSEFECPYCAKINRTLKRVIDKYGDVVSVVYKHNPLPFHKNAMGAAIAAEAAHRQGRFWEMYELLFANQRSLGRQNYLAWAKELGLDLDAFASDLDAPELRERVTRDQKLIQSLGGRGVPNLWINGRHVVGAQPFEKLQSVIDDELGC